ncbi:MAG TPA: sigma-54 dependent transcriptional regulator [Polyangiaceae bacterium]|nr:sigma-54 dependent transcriptional regulator [Polyangiaceae bacterium]
MSNILVVDAEAERALALVAALQLTGHATRTVSTGAAAVLALQSELIDLVIAGREAFDDDGSGFVRDFAGKWPDLPVLVFAGDSEEANAESLRAGAADIINSPISAEEVAFLVSKALAASATRANRPPLGPRRGTELLGESTGIKGVRELLRRVGAGTATTLIRGETGTGKELVARAVHANSPRRGGPFVKIDCASLPDTLLESELFGYERGAFTGATAAKKGRIELAERGTLFLDEIGEVSPVLQAKLLRLLQDREFERLGSRTTQHIDVRFVLATHRDLEAMVDNGSFRHDLFQRINVVTLWIPPLRARRDDIALLAREFARRFGTERGSSGIEFTPDALKLLRAQRWPGNVRQLENFVERLVLLADASPIDAPLVEAQFVTKPEFRTERSEHALDARGAHEEPAPVRLAEILRRAEREALVEALARSAGNRSVAARVLGVSRATLYNKLKELGIE